MQITQFGHSCVRVTDEAGHGLLLDPGTFSDTGAALEGIDDVLITHQHPDHVDAEALVRAATSNPRLSIWAPADTVAQLSDHEALADRLHTSGPGETFVAGGLPVRTFGGQHALIHSSIPVVSNVCYLVGDAVYHPGDSYTVPNAAVEALLVPINAPWAKVGEMIDFAVAVRAPRAFQIHNALLNDIGAGAYEGQLRRVGTLYGAPEFTHLDVGQAVDL